MSKAVQDLKVKTESIKKKMESLETWRGISEASFTSRINDMEREYQRLKTQ